MKSDDLQLDEPARPIAPARFQFSIRALLIATAVVAILCCIFITSPAWVGGLFLLIAMLLAMPAILSAVVFGRERTRAFAVGAMPPMCLVFLWVGMGSMGRGWPFRGYQGDFEMKVFFAIVTAVVVFSGFVGQAVRAWCVR